MQENYRKKLARILKNQQTHLTKNKKVCPIIFQTIYLFIYC